MAENNEIIILKNIVGILDQWWTPIIILTYLFGFCLVIMGLIRMGTHKDRGGGTFYGPTMTMISGICLLSLHSVYDIITVSVFGSEKRSLGSLGYDITTNNVSEVYVQFALALFVFIGLLSCIKGIYMLHTSVKDQKQNEFGAIIHIISGVILVNIQPFLKMIGVSLGGIAESSINNILNLI